MLRVVVQNGIKLLIWAADLSPSGRRQSYHDGRFNFFPTAFESTASSIAVTATAKLFRNLGNIDVAF